MESKWDGFELERYKDAIWVQYSGRKEKSAFDVYLECH